MPKPKDTPFFDLDASIPALINALQTRRILKKADLKTFKVPAGFQEQAFSRLVGEGFEAIKGGVRVPLQLQLETLLQERTVIVGSLGKHLKGGSPKEYKELLGELARDGRIQLLIRGKVEAITGGHTPVLSREEMRGLGPFALSIQKALKGKPMPRTLLREDVRELLLDLVKPAPELATAQAPGPQSLASLVDRLLMEAHRLMKVDMGLCFVPELVLACLPEHPLLSVHEALSLAVRERRIELRPESGMNRLSPLELALCPEGLQGTRLSWARSLEPRP